MDLKSTLDTILNDHDYTAFDTLLSQGLDPNSVLEGGDHLIHLLALNGDLQMMRILFKYDPDPNLLTDYYETALVLAIHEHHFEIVQFLLDQNADPTIADYLGEDALRKATVSNDNAMVKLLLDRKKGQTALDIAQESEYQPIQDFEILIQRIHFIWLGSALNPNTSKNFPQWIKSNKGYEIYMWYDSKLINSAQEEATHQYINSLGKVLVCDIRNYDLLNLAPTEDFAKAIEAYHYETGIWPRAQINPEARNLVNWGFASDVLRMLILYKYEGFYVDVDMEPIVLHDYFADKRIKSCPFRFCMTPYMESEIVDYDISETTSITDTNNNTLYYDSNFDHNVTRMKKYFAILSMRYEWMKSNYYYYLLFYFIRGTVYTSGPLALRSTLDTMLNDDKYTPQFNDNVNYILRGFKEDPNVANISWSIKRYDVLGLLLHDLFNDQDELMRCYYKTFGTEFYDLSLIESNWLTKILALIKDNDLSSKEIKLLDDLSISLSETKIDMVVKLALMLKSRYKKSSVYPSPKDLFITMTTMLFTRQFNWNGNPSELDEITKQITDRLLPLSYKHVEPLHPSFFGSFLEYISHINTIYHASSFPRARREELYRGYYDLIQSLVNTL